MKKKIDPKIGNLTPEQVKAVEKQRKWLNDWNKNRVIDGKKINNNIDIPFSEDIYIDDLNINNTKSKTYGEYDTKSNRIIFDNEFESKPGIPSHEFSHRFQKDLKNNNSANYNQYINKPILNELGNINGLSPYKSDPEENHAEINRFRYNNNLKPDQVITPQDMKGYNREGYNLEHFDDNQMMNLLNKTASNTNLNNVNYAAYGGNLQQQTNNNNMLNEFNEGGTHEQNPLGGIPMGQGANGNMNTVEQGETMKDKFIYSNRITLNPETISKFNLPKSLSGKTVADATKLINKKFEGRNGKIDESTKKNFLDRIAEAQENIKAEEQAKIQASMQLNSQEVPDMMEGQVPEGMEEFTQPQQQMFNGGELSQELSMLGASGAMGEHTGINQATTALDLGQTAFGKSGIDTSGAVDVNPESIKPGMMGVQSAMKGAKAGAMFGPLGAGIGGAVGLTAGLIGGSRAKRDALKAHQNFEIGESNRKLSNFAEGGQMRQNRYNDGGPFDENSVTNPQDHTKGSYSVQPNPWKDQFQANLDYAKQAAANNTEGVRQFGPQSNGHSGYQGLRNLKEKVGEGLNKAGEWVDNNGGKALRYAPVAMNALQLHQLNKQGYDKVNPVLNNTRYNPEYMDEKALTNQINAESNYSTNALANASNGSMGSLRNNILASQLNKTKGLSDAYSKVADVNRNENKTGQSFNNAITEANIGRRIGAEDRTAMNKGAFETEKSKLKGQIGTDLGNIGKEEVYKNLARETFGYTWDGKYYVNDKGQRVTREEMNNKIDETEKGKGAAKKFKFMRESNNFGDPLNFKNKKQ